MGELRKLRLGNAENVVTPYTAGDETIIINETTKQIKVNPEEIATQDDLSSVKEDLNQKADIIISSAEGTVASFSDGAEYDAVSLIAHFEPVQEGSGDPSPVNKREIIPWTGLDIKSCSAQLTPLDDIENPNEYYKPNSTRRVVYNATEKAFILEGSAGVVYSNHACIPNANQNTARLWVADTDITITVYVEYKNVNSPYGIRIYKNGSTLVRTIISNDSVWHTHAETISLAKGEYLTLLVYQDYYWRNLRVIFGSSANVLEPYVGATTHISWQTEAGEVFGGYVDVTRGKLVAGWYGFVLDGVNNYLNSSPNSDENVAWAYDYIGNAGGGLSRLPTSDFSIFNPAGANPAKDFVKVDKFTLVNSTPTSTGIVAPNKGRAYLRLYVTKTELSDVSSATAIRNSLREWLQSNPIQIVYRLSSPIEYDITPTAIELLKGYNNVWNSAGGNNEVQYRADTKLYIDGKQLDIRNTIAPIEDGDTASQAYAVGRYFYRNGSFCKAKTAIASGATFTLGTNYEVTTVSAELYTALH